MTTIINTKIGESKSVARLWLEGEKLARAGVRTGQKYALKSAGSDRAELRLVDDTYQGKTFNVSRRSKNGIEVPLMEVRSDELKEIFSCERVRVALRHGRILVTANYLEMKVRERIRKLVEQMKSGDQLATCSLFHGGGVLDRALHSGLARSGVSSFVQIGVELESVYLDASLRNNPELWRDDSVVVCSDIREMDWGNNVPGCSILVSGIPCTGASSAGRAKNKLEFAESHEDAGALFVDFLNAVKATNPAVVLIENVDDYQKTASMTVIRSVLSSLGYLISEAILDSNDYGTLERRKRLVVVAVSKGMPAFDLGLVQPVRSKENSLNEVLEDVPFDSDRWKPFEYLAAKEERDIAAGKGFVRQLLDGTEGYCGCIGRHYAKCRSTEPFLKHPKDPSLLRIFTPVEHARVKAIPEEMISGVSSTVAHQILGQSVAYPVFDAVGAALGQYLQEFMESAEPVAKAA